MIKTVTVVGANGTMGRNVAAIFASFGDATVFMVSRSLEKSIEAKSKAYQSVRAESIKEKMIPADYSQLEECVKKSDLIFETCAENWKVKESIHTQIAKTLGAVAKDKVICSGTSGLSITKLAECYPEMYRHQFMGMHMFNPPYQMTLCELTPTIYTEQDRTVFEAVKIYAKEILHRTVVETSDSPAFLGNRIGFQFINEAMQMAEKYKFNGGIDYIDALLGGFTGRAMPPLMTANFVGLDVHKAIVDNLYLNTNDYANSTYILPEFVAHLIDEGKTGRKAGAGLYKTEIHDSGVKLYKVYDIEHGYYREQIKYTFPFVEEIISALKIGDYTRAFQTLIENHSMEAKFCCEFLLKYIIYSLASAKEMKCETAAADDVMASGFHWCPPLAMLEAFQTVVDFKLLCKERLSDDVMRVIEEQGLLENLEKSKYDYRKYILAKR